MLLGESVYHCDCLPLVIIFAEKCLFIIVRMKKFHWVFTVDLWKFFVGYCVQCALESLPIDFARIILLRKEQID